MNGSLRMQDCIIAAPEQAGIICHGRGLWRVMLQLALCFPIMQRNTATSVTSAQAHRFWLHTASSKASGAAESRLSTAALLSFVAAWCR
jgi:hypothetical protein